MRVIAPPRGEREMPDCTSLVFSPGTASSSSVPRVVDLLGNPGAVGDVALAGADIFFAVGDYSFKIGRKGVQIVGRREVLLPRVGRS
jgi:hypothetical protein